MESRKGVQQQLSPKFFERSIDHVDEKFKNKFAEPHRKLKAKIHQCQYTAYSKEGLSLS